MDELSDLHSTMNKWLKWNLLPSTKIEWRNCFGCVLPRPRKELVWMRFTKTKMKELSWMGSTKIKWRTNLHCVLLCSNGESVCLVIVLSTNKRKYYTSWLPSSKNKWSTGRIVVIGHAIPCSNGRIVFIARVLPWSSGRIVFIAHVLQWSNGNCFHSACSTWSNCNEYILLGSEMDKVYRMRSTMFSSRHYIHSAIVVPNWLIVTKHTFLRWQCII